MRRKKILWLASWYPNRIDPFNGDFIQRHAQAVGLYHDITVVFVMRDEKGVVTKNVLQETTQTGNVTEHRIYYHIQKTPGVFEKIVSLRRYNQLFKKAIVKHIAENGMPHLVHVHVALKAGWLARWIKKRQDIPYLVTEHSSLFLPEAEAGFRTLPFYMRAVCKKILRDAASVSVVSRYLHGHLKKLVPDADMVVIPNVVDTTIFQPALFKNPIAATRFIHVSGLGHPKNAEAIVQAFAILQQQNSALQLHIVGPRNPSLLQAVQTLRLNDIIFFHPEVPQPQLAQQLAQADALILYSRYETFGCVVIEANACGLPVIVSNIPTMHELVKDGMNGLFAEGENAAALAKALVYFINNKNQFDATQIAQQAQAQYNYHTVGLQFSNWYDGVLKKLRS